MRRSHPSATSTRVGSDCVDRAMPTGTNSLPVPTPLPSEQVIRSRALSLLDTKFPSIASASSLIGGAVGESWDQGVRSTHWGAKTAVSLYATPWDHTMAYG